MRWLLLCSFWSLANMSLAQSRVAMEVNCTFIRGFVSAFYCPVVFQKYYIKTGVSYGNFGTGIVYVNPPETIPEQPTVAPYAEMNRFSDSLVLVRYSSRNKGVGLEIGLGRFLELTPVHTLRFDFQVKAYAMEERIYAAYTRTVDPMGDRRILTFKPWHYALSIGPEVFHAIRVSPRFTVYYGLKFPFFIPLNGNGFQNQSYRMPTKGFHTNLTLGLSCAIGRKNSEPGRRTAGD